MVDWWDYYCYYYNNNRYRLLKNIFTQGQENTYVYTRAYSSTVIPDPPVDGAPIFVPPLLPIGDTLVNLSVGRKAGRKCQERAGQIHSFIVWDVIFKMPAPLLMMTKKDTKY